MFPSFVSVLYNFRVAVRRFRNLAYPSPIRGNKLAFLVEQSAAHAEYQRRSQRTTMLASGKTPAPASTTEHSPPPAELIVLWSRSISS